MFWLGAPVGPLAKRVSGCRQKKAREGGFVIVYLLVHLWIPLSEAEHVYKFPTYSCVQKTLSERKNLPVFQLDALIYTS